MRRSSSPGSPARSTPANTRSTWQTTALAVSVAAADGVPAAFEHIHTSALFQQQPGDTLGASFPAHRISGTAAAPTAADPHPAEERTSKSRQPLRRSITTAVLQSPSLLTGSARDPPCSSNSSIIDLTNSTKAAGTPKHRLSIGHGILPRCGGVGGGCEALPYSQPSGTAGAAAGPVAAGRAVSRRRLSLAGRQNQRGRGGIEPTVQASQQQQQEQQQRQQRWSAKLARMSEATGVDIDILVHLTGPQDGGGGGVPTPGLQQLQRSAAAPPAAATCTSSPNISTTIRNPSAPLSAHYHERRGSASGGDTATSRPHASPFARASAPQDIPSATAAGEKNSGDPSHNAGPTPASPPIPIPQAPAQARPRARAPPHARASWTAGPSVPMPPTYAFGPVASSHGSAVNVSSFAAASAGADAVGEIRAYMDALRTHLNNPRLVPFPAPRVSAPTLPLPHRGSVAGVPPTPGPDSANGVFASAHPEGPGAVRANSAGGFPASGAAAYVKVVPLYGTMAASPNAPSQSHGSAASATAAAGAAGGQQQASGQRRRGIRRVQTTANLLQPQEVIPEGGLLVPASAGGKGQSGGASRPPAASRTSQSFTDVSTMPPGSPAASDANSAQHASQGANAAAGQQGQQQGRKLKAWSPVSFLRRRRTPAKAATEVDRRSRGGSLDSSPGGIPIVPASPTAAAAGPPPSPAAAGTAVVPLPSSPLAIRKLQPAAAVAGAAASVTLGGSVPAGASRLSMRTSVAAAADSPPAGPIAAAAGGEEYGGPLLDPRFFLVLNEDDRSSRERSSKDRSSKDRSSRDRSSRDSPGSCATGGAEGSSGRRATRMLSTASSSVASLSTYVVPRSTLYPAAADAYDEQQSGKLSKHAAPRHRLGSSNTQASAGPANGGTSGAKADRSSASRGLRMFTKSTSCKERDRGGSNRGSQGQLEAALEGFEDVLAGAGGADLRRVLAARESQYGPGSPVAVSTPKRNSGRLFGRSVSGKDREQQLGRETRGSSPRQSLGLLEAAAAAAVLPYATRYGRASLGGPGEVTRGSPYSEGVEAQRGSSGQLPKLTGVSNAHLSTANTIIQCEDTTNNSGGFAFVNVARSAQGFANPLQFQNQQQGSQPFESFGASPGRPAGATCAWSLAQKLGEELGLPPPAAVQYDDEEQHNQPYSVLYGGRSSAGGFRGLPVAGDRSSAVSGPAAEALLTLRGSRWSAAAAVTAAAAAAEAASSRSTAGPAADSGTCGPLSAVVGNGLGGLLDSFQADVGGAGGAVQATGARFPPYDSDDDEGGYDTLEGLLTGDILTGTVPQTQPDPQQQEQGASGLDDANGSREGVPIAASLPSGPAAQGVSVPSLTGPQGAHQPSGHAPPPPPARSNRPPLLRLCTGGRIPSPVATTTASPGHRSSNSGVSPFLATSPDVLSGRLEPLGLPVRLSPTSPVWGAVKSLPRRMTWTSEQQATGGSSSGAVPGGGGGGGGGRPSAPEAVPAADASGAAGIGQMVDGRAAGGKRLPMFRCADGFRRVVIRSRPWQLVLCVCGM